MATLGIGYAADGTAKEYTTIAAALAAASSDDVLELYYGNAYKGPFYVTTANSITINLTIKSGVSGRRAIVISNFNGWIFAVTTEGITVLFEDLEVVGNYYATGATQGAFMASTLTSNVTFRRCVARGQRNGFMTRAVTGVVTGTQNAESCAAISCLYGFTSQNNAGRLYCYNCTAIFCGNGFHRSAGTIKVGNCAADYCITGFFGVSVMFSDAGYNASRDGTAPGATTFDLNSIDPKWVYDHSNGNHPLEPYVIPGSGLLEIGSSDSPAAKDLNGTDFPANKPVGCSLAIWYVDPNYVTSAHTPAGNYVAPAVGDVRPISYGVGLTGTLANLAATDAAYAALEATRNAAGTVAAADIREGKSLTLIGETLNGALDNGDILTGAGGNYVAPAVGDVRPVAFGVDQTGTLANLSAADEAFLALEAERNIPPPVNRVASGYPYTALGVEYEGEMPSGATSFARPVTTWTPLENGKVRLTVSGSTEGTKTEFFAIREEDVDVADGWGEPIYTFTSDGYYDLALEAGKYVWVARTSWL